MGLHRFTVFGIVGLIVMLSLIFLFDTGTTVQEPPLLSYLFSLTLALISIVYFVLVVMNTPIFGREPDMVPAPEILLRTLISAGLCILTFAFFFMGYGMNLPHGDVPNAPTSLYFAMVTFSTLGYGDISPHTGYRLWAALLALVGNLHLGLFVAVLFFRLQQRLDAIKD